MHSMEYRLSYCSVNGCGSGYAIVVWGLCHLLNPRRAGFLPRARYESQVVQPCVEPGEGPTMGSLMLEKRHRKPRAGVHADPAVAKSITTTKSSTSV